MNVMLATGLFGVLFAIVYLIDIVRRKGERFEYAYAMFVGELGLMFVASQLFRSLTITVLFMIALLTTAAAWWRLFSEFKRRTEG